MLKQLFILILLSFYLQATTLHKDKNISLVLPWKHQFQFAGYYMAKELGLYKKHGLNVDIREYDLQRENSKEVATHQAEFGIEHSTLILDKLNNFPNIVLLNAIHQSSPLVLLTKKQAGIQKITDIINKKVMMGDDQEHLATINAMLYTENIYTSNFDTIQTSFHPQELIDNKADYMVAFLSNEPYALEQKQFEYKVFNPADYGYDFYSDILFTSQEMIKHSKKDVDNFREASLEGWQYAYENIDETIELILKKYNTQNKTKEALLYEAKTLQKLAFRKGVVFGDINKNRIQEITTSYRFLKLVENPNATIEFDEFVYLQKPSITNVHKELFHEILLSIYKAYSTYIQAFIFLLLAIVFLVFYFRHKLKVLLKKKIKEINQNYEIFDKYINSSRTDLSGKITYVSQAFMEQTGYTEDEIIGKRHSIFKANDEDTLSKEEYKKIWKKIKNGQTWQGEFKNLNKDGSESWADSVISPIFDEKNKIVGYEAIRTDVTAKKVLENFNHKLEKEVAKQTQKLEKLAITDKLTGLYNRVKLDAELQNNLEYFLKHDEVFSLILIDIDYFKDVNDTYGHQVGDIVLQELSLLIHKLIRSSDTFGRWGGEEFMIICPNTDIEGVYSLASTIVKEVEKHQFSRLEKLTISAGVYTIQENDTIESLVQFTDKALYKAKELGRNRVEK